MFGIELSSIIGTLIGFALLAIAAIGVPVFIIWLLVRVRRGARLREELNTFDFLLRIVSRAQLNTEAIRGRVAGTAAQIADLDRLDTNLVTLAWHLNCNAAELEERLGLKRRNVFAPPSGYAAQAGVSVEG